MFLVLVDGTGAGLGKPVVQVNGGKVSCHVSKTSSEKFMANFIPHAEGRHRIDVKFNGEKVSQSPFFVEVSFHVFAVIQKDLKNLFNLILIDRIWG